MHLPAAVNGINTGGERPCAVRKNIKQQTDGGTFINQRYSQIKRLTSDLIGLFKVDACTEDILSRTWSTFPSFSFLSLFFLQAVQHTLKLQSISLFITYNGQTKAERSTPTIIHTNTTHWISLGFLFICHNEKKRTSSLFHVCMLLISFCCNQMCLIAGSAWIHLALLMQNWQK